MLESFKYDLLKVNILRIYRGWIDGFWFRWLIRCSYWTDIFLCSNYVMHWCSLNKKLLDFGLVVWWYDGRKALWSVSHHRNPHELKISKALPDVPLFSYWFWCGWLTTLSRFFEKHQKTHQMVVLLKLSERYKSKGEGS